MISLLDAVGTVSEHHDGKLTVTLGPETEYLDRPRARTSTPRWWWTCAACSPRPASSRSDRQLAPAGPRSVATGPFGWHGPASAWYARNMVQAAGIGGGATGPWYRVQAITAGPARRQCRSRLRGGAAGGAERDRAPAAVHRGLAVARRRRAPGADHQRRAAAHGQPGPARRPGRRRGPEPEPGGGPALLEELLFPWGARGVPMSGNVLADLDRLVWGPCPGRQAPMLGADPADDGRAGPGSGAGGPPMESRARRCSSPRCRP